MDESREPNEVTAGGPEEVKAEQSAARTPVGSYPTPLFLRDGNEGKKGNAQDEKDEAAE